MLKNPFIKKSVYKELTRELSILAEIDGAQSTCLNILEQLPFELQPQIINDLAETNNPKLLKLFQLIHNEMSGELKKAAAKALTRYVALGYEVEELNHFNVANIENVVFASKTRLQGNCILVFLTRAGKEFQAHYFTLAFNHLGIKEYFQHRSMDKNELLTTINNQDLVSIKFSEAQGLLLDAYNQNKRYGTKTATGFSQYKFLLDSSEKKSTEYSKDTLLKLYDTKLSEKLVINAYIYALKNMDAGLVYDLATLELQKKFGPRDEFISKWTHPFEKCTFIKSILGKRSKQGNKIARQVQLVLSDEQDELKNINMGFELSLENDSYFLNNVDIQDVKAISSSDDLNPLNYKVYTTVFKINNHKKVQDFLNNCDAINLTGEFGESFLCYKWFKSIKPLENGIDISQGVYGEFILTEKELIVFGANLTDITELTYFILERFSDVRGVKLQLEVRNLATIREIYQVINQPELLLGNFFARETNYLIPPVGYQDWYQYCKKEGIEFNLLDNKIKTFQICSKEKSIEVIFHEKCGVINLYNCSFQEAKKLFQFPNQDVLGVKELVSDNAEKWLRLKLMRVLNQDVYTKAYVPWKVQQMAKELQLVIT